MNRARQYEKGAVWLLILFALGLGAAAAQQRLRPMTPFAGGIQAEQ